MSHDFVQFFRLTFLCLLCGQSSYALTDGEGYFEDWSWSDYNHDDMPDGPIDLDGVTVNGSHGEPQCYSCECDSFFCPGGDPNNLSDPDPEPVPDWGYGASIGGEPNQPKDPCDKNQQMNVKNQITDPYLAAKLAQVRSSLQPPNTVQESGFPVYKNSMGINIPGSIVSGTNTNPSVSIGFNISDPVYIPSALVHSHPSAVYANPSAGDIYGLIGVYSTVNTVTTSYIVAADGTTYAMVITDPTALASFITTYPASANQSNDSFTPNSPMEILYRSARTSFINSGLSDAVAEERANGVVMAQAGINLLKAPASSTDFKQIQGSKVTDNNGNVTFTKLDCP